MRHLDQRRFDRHNPQKMGGNGAKNPASRKDQRVKAEWRISAAIITNLICDPK